MAAKGKLTESNPMRWNDFLNLVSRMTMDIENSKMSESKRKHKSRFLMFIAIGSYSGLRASDLLKLKWEDIFNKEQMEVTEKKTKKNRKITLNKNLKNVVAKQFRIIEPGLLSEYIFTTQNGSRHYSIQYVNRKLKDIFKEYEIKVSNPSTHSLRKTFGKRVYEMNHKSENALILLSQIFNHSSVSITRRYIGLQQEKIKDVYLNL